MLFLFKLSDVITFRTTIELLIIDSGIAFSALGICAALVMLYRDHVLQQRWRQLQLQHWLKGQLPPSPTTPPTAPPAAPLDTP